MKTLDRIKEKIYLTLFNKPVLQSNDVARKYKQKNMCGYCGCYCICDYGCNGDTNKCTSKEAIKKACTHHCGCYRYKNYPK